MACWCPRANAAEAAVVEGLNVFPIGSLAEAVDVSLPVRCNAELSAEESSADDAEGRR